MLRVLRRSVLILMAGIGVALAVAPAASAAWPGLSGRIGLTQDPRSKDIWALARDGTATQLTFTGNDEEQSSWAPDGRRIAFKRSNEVFVRDVTTDAAPVRLTTKAVSAENNTQPGWSPDGASIVFRSNRAEPGANVADIWIMNADGSGQRALVVQEGDQRYPALSPDGKRLVYTSRSEGGTFDLWLAAADGTRARKLYDSGREDSAPAWSPDGRRIAFETHGPVESTDGDIFVLDLKTEKVAQLTSDPADAPVHDEGPAWSPDGTMIAFTSERSDPRGDIWIARADGGDPQRLTANDILDESPDWQPLPFSVGTPGLPRVACGDLSLLPGGAASIAAVKVPCEKARRVVAAWVPGTTMVRGYECTPTPHSFDQEIVECLHRGGRRGIAFVWRRPAA
jgi:Tol biopolymer transport system component